MPRITLSKELKEALSDLPDREKDKLIYRLLPKDGKLVDRLIFQLLEQGATLEDRREELKDEIERRMARYPGQYYSPGYLHIELREISGRITYHKDVTGDKFGEVELNYLMIAEITSRNFDYLKEEGYFAIRKWGEYVIKRLQKLEKLSAKLHEDYLLEFEEYAETVADLLPRIPALQNIIKEFGWQP
ncbi:MAG: hypothetical protein AAFQ02_12075 [Bacteroidota bacterium]